MDRPVLYVWRVATFIVFVVLQPVRPNSRLFQRFFIFYWLANILVWILIERGISWWSKRRIETWPSADAFVEFANVKDVQGGRRPSGYALDLSYSYQVEGTRYGGVHREEFDSEAQAKRSLRFFKDLPVSVRYDRRDPSRSVLDPHWQASLATRAFF